MKTKKMKTKKLLKRLLLWRSTARQVRRPAVRTRRAMQPPPGRSRPGCSECLWTDGGQVCRHRALSDGRTQEALDRVERSGATWS